MVSPRFIISGGGTGGHIFPAIAVANSLKRKYSTAEILFVGALGRMEMEKVPKAGYNIEGLWISGIQRKMSFKNIMFPFMVVTSLLDAWKIMRKFKPDVVAGFGGFASWPVLQMACKKGIPAVIQEQNSYAGVANKSLAKQVDKICVAYDGMDKYFPKEKIIITGNPVRQDLSSIHGKRDEGMKYFGLNPNKKTVLIVGGSLGARTINESINQELKAYFDNDVQLIWQTGKAYAEQGKEAVKLYEDAGIKAHEFIQRMDLAYAVADLVVSRAGAMSVSELCLAAKATILIPSPNVAEDHQTKNAMAVVNKNAAILVRDVDSKDVLKDEVFRLLTDHNLRKEMEQNISNLAHKDSADIIANEISLLIKN